MIMMGKSIMISQKWVNAALTYFPDITNLTVPQRVDQDPERERRRKRRGVDQGNAYKSSIMSIPDFCLCKIKGAYLYSPMDSAILLLS